MSLSGILGTALTATTNPDPNTLTPKNPYPTPYVDRRTVSAAWTSQASKLLVPRMAKDGQGTIAVPVHFVPTNSGATWTAIVWQYNQLANIWFRNQANSSVAYTDVSGYGIGNLITDLYLDCPIFIQLSTISAGSLSIYFDPGLAEAK